ncbi:MAG: GH3 auxin-responsive promoter family protein, partial [Spirosomaceae bacterium]|nr:GH3 auxin-responsive promoter family protein [Spirosomataceae bacterium]
FAKLSTIRDFQEAVPISTYESLYPYIERALRGEGNVLWPSEIEWFSVSSGTTNARSKYIPVSKESLEECHYRGGKDVMTIYFENNPESALFDGKGLSIGGSLKQNPFDNHTQVGDVSAVIMQNLPSWAQFIRSPSLEVALLPNWEEKMERMIAECSTENITSLLGVPTWCVVLLENIMKQKGISNMLEIWPDFELFVHGAVSFTPYRELFKTEFFPSPEVYYMETYNASEGFFAIQDDLSSDGEMLLLLDYGIFYEFMQMSEWEKENPQTLTIDEVEIGTSYAMIISTNAGLWRYNIGDTVRFTSKYPFRIKISGRTKHFINAFGEEVIIENAETAIKEACKVSEATISDFTAAPVFMQSKAKGGHEWIIECPKFPNNERAFIETLDNTLREINSDYDAKRRNNAALDEPKVHFVAQGTFYKWMEKRGKLGGQNKVPRLSNSREFVEDILEMLTSS